MEAALRILWYLKGTKEWTLNLGDVADIAGFSDSDWGGDRDNRRSISAYIFRMGGGSISWKTRKQTSVALSSVSTSTIGSTVSTGLPLPGIYIALSTFVVAAILPVMITRITSPDPFMNTAMYTSPHDYAPNVVLSSDDSLSAPPLPSRSLCPGQKLPYTTCATQTLSLAHVISSYTRIVV